MMNETYEWTCSTNYGFYDLFSPVESSKNGLNCSWKLTFRDSDVAECFHWQFDWDALKQQGVEGFEGTICVFAETITHEYGPLPICRSFPKTFNVSFSIYEPCIEELVGKIENADAMCFSADICFSSHFVLTPIMNTDDSRLLEENFKASNKTDAILVIDGRKLHVNKMFLSFHSEFFDALFNSNFKEKLMQEIPIGDVKYQDFARLLSAVYPNPILPSVQTAATLLKLADRFTMPMVTHLVEPFLIRNTDICLSKKIALADKYSLNELMNSCLVQLNSAAEVKKITMTTDYRGVSNATKAKLFHRMKVFV